MINTLISFPFLGERERERGRREGGREGDRELKAVHIDHL